MLPPSPEILPFLATFAPLMTAPTFQNACALLLGTILTPGARTVTAALRVLGQAQGNFSRFHHFFSRAHWSPGAASPVLLRLLLRCFHPGGEPVVLLADEHLERRAGAHVAYRGLFRDPVRSTTHYLTYAWGVRWLVLAVLVPVPWSTRPWALPFLAFPLLSAKVCQARQKPHTSVVEWLARWITRVRRWLPDQELVLVGDGTYASLALAHTCRVLTPAVRLVSRLRLDAALYDFPAPQPPGKRGRKPQKGPALPKLAAQLTDPTTRWQTLLVQWYGRGSQPVEIVTGIALWYRCPQAPLPLRWVLVRSPEGSRQPIMPGACFCTDPDVSAEQILRWYLGRWNIEVTFAEIRAHLGLETQRHWCPRAVQRVVPCLLAAFSLVVVWAKSLYPEELPTPTTAWYRKQEATFGDALAVVRRHLWDSQLPPVSVNKSRGSHEADRRLIPRAVWDHVMQVLCYAP